MVLANSLYQDSCTFGRQIASPYLHPSLDLTVSPQATQASTSVLQSFFVYQFVYGSGQMTYSTTSRYIGSIKHRAPDISRYIGSIKHGTPDISRYIGSIKHRTSFKIYFTLTLEFGAVPIVSLATQGSCKKVFFCYKIAVLLRGEGGKLNFKKIFFQAILREAAQKFFF